MNFLHLLSEKSHHLKQTKIPTVAFLGDSVTQGCFECYIGEEDRIETVFDRESGYPRDLEKIFALLYPNTPINLVNAGISGTTADFGFSRLERDVLCHKPDLTVVCFGLNDCGRGMVALPDYANSLRCIFQVLMEAGSEVIFLTPNMMNSDVSVHICDAVLREIAEKTATYENNGILAAYLAAARKVAAECGVPVCDVYAKWKRLENYGVHISDLLANYINHPIRPMHWLFAYSLMETLMEC